MSIWDKIAELAAQVSGKETISAFLDRVAGYFTSVSGSETRRQMAFTVAMIALSAKMAKADGVVTQDEIIAFKQIVEIPSSEARNVARVFNLAKRDVAGYEAYAAQLSELLKDESETLVDIVDGLFHIAKADGVIHENELSYLEHVADIFGLEDRCFSRIKARHMSEHADPYAVLGVDREMSDSDIKRQYRKLVAEHHPDRMMARGVPQEFIELANQKLADVNVAWGEIAAERGLR
ncbi:TerB family tellurite resistance protein [Coralliovum pocilloporae]|uniref:TerB family tellurite resistance protein n=1 Tax=Coralliovum pocilloporae TaxID=3066369 RepID=UPI003306FBE0